MYNEVDYVCFLRWQDMDKIRKDIVLKEIRYWKEHRLLPEQYCDFLLSLYTEGSEAEQQIYEKKSHSFKSLFIQMLYIYILLQLVITLVVIYFTEISIDLQIAIFTVFVIICLGSVIYFYRKKHLFFHVSLIVGILILFLATVHIVSKLFSGEQLDLLFIILMNCILWIFIGFKLNLKYLIISGITGAVLLITYTFI